MFTFAPSWIQLLTFLVAVALPVLVGLVTTRVTSSTTKTLLLSALALLTGLGTEALAAINTGTVYDLADGLQRGLTALVISIALHYGVWKPTGVSAAAQRLGAKTPDADGVYAITDVGAPTEPSGGSVAITSAAARDGSTPKHSA